MNVLQTMQARKLLTRLKPRRSFVNLIIGYKRYMMEMGRDQEEEKLLFEAKLC